MSFWGTIGDVMAGAVTQLLNVLGVNIGQKRLFSSDKSYGAMTSAQKLVSTVGATVAGANVMKNTGIVNSNSQTIPAYTSSIPNTMQQSVYSNDQSIIEQIARAFAGQINIGENGRVSGSVEIGRPQTSPIINSFSKNIVWIIVGVLLLLVLIFKRK